MATAVVKDNHLKFNGKNYFRVGSEDVGLGSYGEKKSPLTQGNYLEVQDHIPTPKLKVKEAVEVEIDFSESTERDILANINVAGVFQGSAGTAYADLKSRRLKLVKLRIDNEDIKDAINQSPKVIEDLIEYGNDARIAHQVFIILEDTLARTVTTGTSFSVAVDAGKVKLTVTGGTGSSSTATITLSENMTFAYGLVKLDWDAQQKKNMTKATKATDDQWGPA
jgi:hypothetical protein